jgi:hypothetical protein
MKLYNIVYRWTTLCGKAGDIFVGNVTHERAVYLLRAHGDLYGRNFLLVEAN